MANSDDSLVELVRQEVFSDFLDRVVTVDYYVPARKWWQFWKRPYVILFHDGQDLDRMNFLEIYRRTFQNSGATKPLVVAIHANEDRMREYGTAAQTDYAGRGDRAHLHERFVLEELLPAVQSAHRTHRRVAVAGFSLGGLAAFDLAWRNPRTFHRVGVFSGALWWRSQAFNPAAPDDHLIVHEMVKSTPAVSRQQKFWFQTGTLDETDDRNNNGIIDSIDDTLHLIRCLNERGYKTGTDIEYLEVEGGRHDVPTWTGVMPEFLGWLVR